MSTECSCQRPNIGEVLSLLEEARASTGVRDEESERKRVELVRTLQNHPMDQVRDWVLIAYSTANTSLLYSEAETACHAQKWGARHS